LASRTSTASQAAFSKLIKGATLKVYADAPHGLTVTHKDKFNADLLTFVKSVQ
jgi:non-heme chloroperoxidase